MVCIFQDFAYVPDSLTKLADVRKREFDMAVTYVLPVVIDEVAVSTRTLSNRTALGWKPLPGRT